MKNARVISLLCQYIKNTGDVTPAQFDDDWDPIGPKLREDMRKADLILAIDNLTLTGRGEEFANG